MFVLDEMVNQVSVNWLKSNNNLPQEVECAASVDDYKKLIDQYSSNTMYKCM